MMRELKTPEDIDDVLQDEKEQAIRQVIRLMGDDPDREGLKDTPKRVLKSFDHLFSGYQQRVADVLTVFDQAYDELVLIKNIEFFSTCEHHLLPFYGKAHVAYIPNGKKVVGASKLVRVLEIYSRRLQIQERISVQVAEALMTHLDAIGAACILEAQHLCMACRGVERQGARMVTSCMLGDFRNDAAARAELLSLIKL